MQKFHDLLYPNEAIDFNFDTICIPDLYSYISYQDEMDLYSIATSIKLAGKLKEKKQMITEIMERRGFKRLDAGTNRLVFKYLEDQRFVAKVAVDSVGARDNPRELYNQTILKPYVTRVFQCSQSGAIALTERVEPIRNRMEFEVNAGMIYAISQHFTKTTILSDFGTKFFKNWGVRRNWGPVLLDFPYLYKLDSNKLYCTKETPFGSGQLCGGEIDYDDGFNKLVCTKCGKVYKATDLAKTHKDLNIIRNEGDFNMRGRLILDGKVIAGTDTDESKVIVTNTFERHAPIVGRLEYGDSDTKIYPTPEGKLDPKLDAMSIKGRLEYSNRDKDTADCSQEKASDAQSENISIESKFIKAEVMDPHVNNSEANSNTNIGNAYTGSDDDDMLENINYVDHKSQKYIKESKSYSKKQKIKSKARDMSDY